MLKQRWQWSADPIRITKARKYETHEKERTDGPWFFSWLSYFRAFVVRFGFCTGAQHASDYCVASRSAPMRSSWLMSRSGGPWPKQTVRGASAISLRIDWRFCVALAEKARGGSRRPGLPVRKLMFAR